MDEECNREVAERGEVVASFATSDAVVVPFGRGNDVALFTVASYLAVAPVATTQSIMRAVGGGS